MTHFHSERCYATGSGDTEVLICDDQSAPLPPLKANAIAVLVMGGHVAAQAVSSRGGDTYANVLLGQLEAIGELLKPSKSEAHVTREALSSLVVQARQRAPTYGQQDWDWLLENLAVLVSLPVSVHRRRGEQKED